MALVLGVAPSVPNDVRFFTIADAEHFLGLVAMVNSLRIHGHSDPVTVLDLGLSDAQRSELAGECDIVPPPPDMRDNPWLLAPRLCQMRPAETVVYLDSDVIVTASLDELLTAARSGAICAFPDVEDDRWFAEWEEIFGLSCPPRRQRYLNAGFVAFSTRSFPALLPRWAECCERISRVAGSPEEIDRTTPTALADQDALNALLMSEFSVESVAVQPESAAAQGRWQLAKTRVVDRRLVACRRAGTATVLLHSWGRPKPWQVAAGPLLRRTAYLVCLRRLLNGGDVVVRTSQPRVAWLEPGVRGAIALRRQTAEASARLLSRRLHARGFVRRVRARAVAVMRAGAQPVRAVRAASDGNFRRAYPWEARRAVSSLAIAVGVVALALLLGRALGSWIPAIVVVLGFAGEAVDLAWKQRRQRGRAQGWPPGSVRAGPDAMIVHDHFARRKAREGPVFKTMFAGSPTVCIADLDFARALFREHATDLSHAWGPIERFVPGGTIREGSEPRHTVLRRLHTRALTPGVVRSWEPTITQRVASHLTTMALDAPDRGVDPRPHVREMVLATWSDLLLGIPPEDPAYDEVSTLVSDLDPDRHIYARALPDDEVLRNLDRFAALLVNAQRERGRFRDCPSMAMRFEETEPGALTDPGTVRNVIYETINTRDDMAGLLMWVLKFLADDPAWLARLRAADGDEVGLADRIVSETLRLAQSEYIFRRAVREIRFGGVVIPATWAVRVCIHEIHRDPEKFDHADRFDPDRFRDDGCGRELYAPFGIDHHSCVGESLARTMARIFVTELARGFDAETIRDGPVELTIERHWAPSSRWRVALRTRTTAGAGVEDRA